MPRIPLAGCARSLAPAKRLRWLSGLLLGLLAHGATGASCPPEPSAPTPEFIQQLQVHARNRGFLWKISKGGHASWLYGTLHIGRAD